MTEPFDDDDIVDTSAERIARLGLRMAPEDALPAFRFERSNIAKAGHRTGVGRCKLSTIVYATGAVVGDMLASTKALATLLISIFVVGMAACTLPAGAVAQRHGRRAAFMIGTGCGVLGGLIGTLAVLQASFWLFCVATYFGGVYAAVVLSFRFAAGDCAAPERRPRALSAVMAGGVFAGVIGPQLVTYTMGLWQTYLFAATYLDVGCAQHTRIDHWNALRERKDAGLQRARGRARSHRNLAA